MILVYALSAICLFISVAALTVSLFRRPASGISSLRRHLSSLESEIEALGQQLLDVRATLKRATAREAMREARAKRHEAPMEDSDGADADPEAARAATKRKTAKALGMPENPVQAVLANLGGQIRRGA